MAVSEISTKLENILKCADCKETVKDPQTLDCFHSFCKHCTDNLPTTQQDGQPGIQCPVCSAFCSEKSISANFLVNELLDLYTGMQNGHTKCEQCLKNAPLWKCLDCKLDLCEDCKLAHLRIPLLKNHRVMEQSKVDETVADHLVFCPEHSDEPVRFNCRECETLICVNCKVNEHDSHETETVENSLKRMFYDVKDYSLKMDNVIKEMNESLEELASQKVGLKAEFNECRIQAQENLDDIIELAKLQHSNLLKELDTCEQEELTKLETAEETYENKKKECNHVMQWVDTSVETAKGATLMAEMQTGLLNKVKRLTQFKVTQIVSLDFPYLDSSSLNDNKDNLAGKVRYQRKVILKSKSRSTFPETFEQMRIGHSINLAGKCTRMGLVNGNLWCLIPDKKFIEVIDVLVGNKAKDIKLPNGIVPRSVQQAANGEILLASDSGVYLIQPNCSVLSQLMKGKYSDLSIDGNIMVALNYGTSEVDVLKHEKRSWQHISKFRTGKENTSEVNTILFSYGNKHIFVTDSSHVVEYRLDGSHVKVYDKLGWPYLCEVDGEDKVLVAESSKNHLRLISPSNNNMHEIICPYGCVIISDQDMWVLKANPYQVINFKG